MYPAFITFDRHESLTRITLRHSSGQCSSGYRSASSGADVNARSPQQRTPLHVAAEEGNAVLTGILVAAGADINAKMKYGETPLDRAADCGYIVQLNDLDFTEDALDLRLQKSLFDMMIKTVIEPDSATALVNTFNNPDNRSTIDTILQQHNLDSQIIDEIKSAFCTTLAMNLAI